MQFVLAFRNLLASRGRMGASIAGVAFASFLMAIQGGLLFGFTQAASRLIDGLGADLWIVPKGIPAFDFVSTVPVRYADEVLAAPGVAATGLGVAGWTPYQKPGGDRTFVMVVGVERGFLGRSPDIPLLEATRGAPSPAIAVDETDAATLRAGPGEGLPEIRQRRARVAAIVGGFSSFLGTPFAFASYQEAHRYVGLPPERAGFVLVKLTPGADPVRAREWIRFRLPDVDIWTASEFSNRSRAFWLVQTGAGGALSLAAILGFLIGMVIVAQTIYGITSEAVEEYATLRAMGASSSYVRAVVRIQALACCLLGGTFGLALVKPFESQARHLVTWIQVPPWMFVLVAFALCLMSLAAARIGARPALAIDPGRVFRA